MAKRSSLIGRASRLLHALLLGEKDGGRATDNLSCDGGVGPLPREQEGEEVDPLADKGALDARAVHQILKGTQQLRRL